MSAFKQLPALVLIFLIALYPGTSLLADTDGQSLNSAQIELLFETLANAQSETEGRYAEDAVWQYWFSQAPSKSIRKNLDAALERREAYDFESAEILLNEIVASAPDYAEGYNQRAFVLFLREKYVLAEENLKKTLELQPNHFAALSGLFHVHGKLGKSESALEYLRQAVTIHPWIKERFGLPKHLWPDSYRAIHEPGTEI